MSGRWLRTLCLLVILSFAAGCSVVPRAAGPAGPGPEGDVAAAPPRAGYLRSRARDFADILGIRVSFGKGLIFNPQVTKFLMVGFENYRVAKLGFYGREAGYWKERNLGGGILFYYDNYGFRRRPKWGTVQPVHGPTHTNIRDFGSDRKSFRGERDIGDIGVTVHCVVGIGLELRAFELLDFFTGLVCVDIAGDDR